MVSSFNSRTLGRVRRSPPLRAPGASRFQFTHPGKGATAEQERVQLSGISFQFTHPGKGATADSPLSVGASTVSIHAPWEGCDLATPYGQSQEVRFNSRTLGRVRPGRQMCAMLLSMFQFTHPGKGATWLVYPRAFERRVSIHAPWEGCD